MKTAIITGLNGQDAPYLCKFLLAHGYKVIGADRRRSKQEYRGLVELEIYDEIEIAYFDLLDYSSIKNLITKYMPDEFYNLAAMSFVGASFEVPITTFQVNTIGVGYILDVIKNYSPQTKFYQASTSEMFGKVQETPQSEKTPFYPRSPYGISKLASHWLTINYREAFGLHTSSGILFNHESKFRGDDFVTQKIAKYVGNWDINKQPLRLGNLDARRDWSHASDLVEGMYLMLQKGGDYVLASGKTRTIKDFVETAFRFIGENIAWQGQGIETKGIVKNRVVVVCDEKFYRPSEVDILSGDPEKARRELGWNPKVSFWGLVTEMVTYHRKKV